LFTSAPATLSLSDLGGLDPAAQERSEAWWRLRDVYGESVASLGTLKDALGALADGRVGVVGADALVGGYIARDFKGIVPAGTIAVYPVEVAVVGTEPALAEGVRDALSDLESSGTLAALRAKWAGPAAAYAYRTAQRRSKPATVTPAPKAP
jgi:ABC-type amino acid transport substrate-binding protein